VKLQNEIGDVHSMCPYCHGEHEESKDKKEIICELCKDVIDGGLKNVFLSIDKGMICSKCYTEGVRK